jgi:hypothetical protein
MCIIIIIIIIIMCMQDQLHRGDSSKQAKAVSRHATSFCLLPSNGSVTAARSKALLEVKH